MQLPNSPEHLLDVLLNPRQIPRRPGLSLVDWILEQMEHDDKFAHAIRAYLPELMRSREILADETGEAWQSAFEVIRRAKVREAISPVRKLVETREMVLPIGDYSDLHGRALEFLNQIDPEFNPLRCWETELGYRDYAPLAFSFVRDRNKWQIPALLSPIARLGFLKEAMRTVLVRYILEGFAIIREGAVFVRNEGDSFVIKMFLDSVSRIGLEPREEHEVRSILGAGSFELLPLVDVDASLDGLIVNELSRVGVPACRTRPHGFKENLLLVKKGGREFYSEPTERLRLIEVYHEGDPFPSQELHPAIVIPSFVQEHEEIAKFICGRILTILRADTFNASITKETSLSVPSARAPSPATMEALEEYASLEENCELVFADN